MQTKIMFQELPVNIRCCKCNIHQFGMNLSPAHSSKLSYLHGETFDDAQTIVQSTVNEWARHRPQISDLSYLSSSSCSWLLAIDMQSEIDDKSLGRDEKQKQDRTHSPCFSSSSAHPTCPTTGVITKNRDKPKMYFKQKNTSHPIYPLLRQYETSLSFDIETRLKSQKQNAFFYRFFYSVLIQFFLVC